MRRHQEKIRTRKRQVTKLLVHADPNRDVPGMRRRLRQVRLLVFRFTRTEHDQPAVFLRQIIDHSEQQIMAFRRGHPTHDSEHRPVARFGPTHFRQQCGATRRFASHVLGAEIRRQQLICRRIPNRGFDAVPNPAHRATAQFHHAFQSETVRSRLDFLRISRADRRHPIRVHQPALEQADLAEIFDSVHRVERLMQIGERK